MGKVDGPTVHPLTLTHPATLAIWAISAATFASIMLRPFRLGEWVWPVLGAALLVGTGLVSGPVAADGALDGLDVYLFLAGMIALAELARVHDVFDWIGAGILRRSNGNAAAAFAWVYVAGVAVTALLSNDGSIVLLTPAVLALTKRASLPRAPYLYACAFVANAASFVLPVSNPANLVLFRHLPKLAQWLPTFAFSSVAAIAMTFFLLRLVFGGDLGSTFAIRTASALLSPPARLALICVSTSIAIVIVCAGLGISVGRVAFGTAVLSVLVVGSLDRKTPGAVIRQGPWSIIPLVAGLFVVTSALDKTGALVLARNFFRHAGALPNLSARLLVGGTLTLAGNILNNLPVGVITRYALHDTANASHVANAALIGIDLGPNLSLTGSLATLLWLLMLRRDGIEVNAWKFLALGTAVTIPTLLLALLCLR